MPEIYFLIGSNWEKLNREVWNSLEKSVHAPSDLYIELLRFFYGELHIDPNVEALNDQELAREEFRKFQVPPNELSCVSILEGFYDVLKQFSNKLAESYRSKLSRFLTEHNIRYHLTPDCRFELSLQGLLVTQYTHLSSSIVNRQDRIECLKELETSLSRLNDRDEERNCIRIASNLLEGLVVDRTNRSGITLGKALDLCNDLFPHDSLKECVKNIYRFSCDYPNIRHPGTPSSRRRALKKDDALLLIALTLGLSSFISNSDASGSILSGSV